MRKMRKLIALGLALAISLTTVTVMKPEKTEATSTKTFVDPGCAVKDGKYIYYAYQGDGMRMGITRYDSETGKKKVIFDSNEVGRGYSKFWVKGDYIYFVWSKVPGNVATCDYLYRIGKDGKHLKELAVAGEYAIKGKKIYYLDEKIVKDDEIYSVKTGKLYSMNLDGTGKKLLKTIKSDEIYNYTMALYNNKVVYTSVFDDRTFKGYHTLDGKKIKISSKYSMEGTVYTSFVKAKSQTKGATFEVKENARNILYRKEAGKEARKLIKFNRDIVINDYTVCENQVFIRAFDTKSMKGYIYMVAFNGTKKQLKAWNLAE